MTITNPGRSSAKIPGPRPNEMLKVMTDTFRDRLGLMTRVSEKYGDVVRFKMGPKALYFLNHPDHAKYVLADNASNYIKGIGLIHAKKVLGDGLLTSEGELWKRQRKTINPAFHRRRLKNFSGVVVNEGERLIERWRQRTAHGPFGPVDVVKEMTSLTLQVLGQSLLNTDLGAYEQMGHAFDVVQDQAMFEMTTLNMVPHTLPLPRHFRFRSARRELERIVQDIVRSRGENERGDDMLSRLLADTVSEPDERVRRRRLRDELITILLAGHETTAATLSFAWYEMSRHPEVGEKMRAEVLEILGDDGVPAYEDLHRLTYTMQVIQETMRLHPPVWILPRRTIAADQVDGYDIPAGADVLICPYTLHRHPEYWPEPEKFDPNRFGSDRAAARHSYAYIPFGAGPRFCVGNNLGMMEAVFVAAMTAREFRLELQPGRKVIEEPMLSLRAKGGLPMIIHRV